jgi:hypothetical protein
MFERIATVAGRFGDVREQELMASIVEEVKIKVGVR